MKVKNVRILAAALATAFTISYVPAADAQRNNGTFVGRPQQPNVPPQPQGTPFPSSVILPMGNPVGPMGNPVQPIIQSPFMRYSGTTPTVVIPEQQRDNRGGNVGRGRDVVRVPVAVPVYYYPPYYNNYYPEPAPASVTVPGQLPGPRYDYPSPGVINPSPNAAPASPPAGRVDLDSIRQPEVYSEPRMIINEPRPTRVIVPPALGTSRADVLATFGQPWGTFLARGQETLYFDGLVLVLTDGRVTQVR